MTNPFVNAPLPITVDDMPCPANTDVTVERPIAPPYVYPPAEITLSYRVITPDDAIRDRAITRAVMPRAGAKLKTHTVNGVKCCVVSVGCLRPDGTRTIKFIEYRKPAMPKPPQHGRIRYALDHRTSNGITFTVTRGRKHRIGFVTRYADGRHVSRMGLGPRVVHTSMREALKAFEFTWRVHP